jgi:hypothetical protein
METPEKRIPNYVFDDLLFQRRLERTLNAESEKLNTLLAEHVRLLEARRKLIAEVHEAVQQRWKDEEGAASNIHSVKETEEPSHGE